MSDHWHRPLMYGAPPPPAERVRAELQEGIKSALAALLDQTGPPRGRRVQEAIAMVASLPPYQLEWLAHFLDDEGALVSCGAHGNVPDHKTADAYRAVAALLRVIHEEQQR